tara:strand:+ start:1245 stop:1961 length:717 start_codon:yes stop_codon:yes gene_type:complete
MIDNNQDDDASFPEMIKPVEPEVVEIQQVVVEEPAQEEYEDEDEEVYVEPLKKEILNKKDIFISTPSSKKNVEIKQDQDVLKKPKRTRFMTDEAKAKLAIARAKGMETRKRNALLRKQAKAEKLEEKEIVKAVQKKRVAKLKQELESDDEEAPPVVKEVKPKKVEIVVEPVEPKSIGYSQNQLESAIYKALSLENENRKVRKAEKKKLKEEELHKQKIFNTVQKAVNPQEEMWANCFT